MTDLREFASRYIVRDDGSQDAPWSLEISGRLGTIYPRSEDGTLAVLATSAHAIRKLTEAGLKVLQRGDGEAVLIFAPKDLDRVAAMIRAKKRRQLNLEHRAKAVAALARARLAMPRPVLSA